MRQMPTKERIDVSCLVRVATDAGNTLHPKVKRLHRKSGLFEEWHDEAAQTAIDVETDLVLGRELAKRDNVVLAPVREVHSRTNELQF